MIDLIIPYYNNLEGLATTLASINYDIFDVTIVDDGSNSAMSLPETSKCDIILTENGGPGYARQIGIMWTENDYIMFIDTGDIFVSKEIQKKIPRVIQANPNANLISFPYYYKDKITGDSDNRMHGKIYKRSFIDKYDITFCMESSYMNEDIGFNRTCRLCTNAELIPIVYMSNPIIKWIENENSLTCKNNHTALYRDQTRALSLNAIHTINICRKNNINPETEINQIAIALYYWFVRTAAENPTYIQDAWDGARIFYKYFEKEIYPNKLSLGNQRLKQCLYYRGKVSFTINILRFAHDILTNEIIPNNYLT